MGTPIQEGSKVNVGDTYRPDENAPGSSERNKGYTPGFANHSNNEQMPEEKETGEDLLRGNRSGESMHGNVENLQGPRKRNKTRLVSAEKYWVDAVPAKQQGIHAFAKRAEKCDAIFRNSIDRTCCIWGSCKDAESKLRVSDIFRRFLSTPQVYSVLSEGGLLLLASENRASNMRNLWLALCFGEYTGYSSVWTPSEVMDAYKSDDLYVVSNAPSLLCIYLSSTDLDGSTATRRTHFLNNLSAVISARKGKPTIICRDMGGFYPNTSTFKTISETFKQGITLN